MRAADLLARTIMAGCLAVLLTGCSQAATPPAASSSAPPPSSTAAEPAAPTGGGGWMDGIPASVPKFESGTFDKAQSNKMQAGDQTIYSLYYEGVQKADVEAYLEKLKAAGFSITPDNVGDGISAGGELKKGSEKLIGLSVSLQGNGHVDYTINVLKAGQ
jgi:hypothetical protein